MAIQGCVTEVTRNLDGTRFLEMLLKRNILNRPRGRPYIVDREFRDFSKFTFSDNYDPKPSQM